MLTCPPDEVRFYQLEEIARSDPGRALARWGEVKAAALEELRAGRRASYAVEGFGHEAWGLAEFAALRAELTAEWHPRNGIERQLIDTMAQAQTGYLYWLQNLTMRTDSGTLATVQLVSARWSTQIPGPKKSPAKPQTA